MSFLKFVVTKFSAGILYGAGFVIGLSVIGYFAMPYFENKMQDDFQTRNESFFIEYDESAKLSVTVTKEQIGDGEFTLLGYLENDGDKSWGSVTLRVELFDAEGSFIEECTEYVSQTSSPQSTLNFKLSCGNKCSKFQLENYNRYTLSIADARHKM